MWNYKIRNHVICSIWTHWGRCISLIFRPSKKTFFCHYIMIKFGTWPYCHCIKACVAMRNDLTLIEWKVLNGISILCCSSLDKYSLLFSIKKNNPFLNLIFSPQWSSSLIIKQYYPLLEISFASQRSLTVERFLSWVIQHPLPTLSKSGTGKIMLSLPC